MIKTTKENAVAAAQHPILLETPAQLAEARNRWKKSEILGIDTEFVRERTYRADLGLVQLSDGESAWLVDPIAIDDLEPLVETLVDPNIVKVLHSGSEDLEVLLHTLGAMPDPLVDSQVACAMLGQPLQLGYHHAVKWLFDIEIDKDQTRSNWCRRPLTEKQLHYAAMDVVLLPEMYRELKARLQETGRWDWLIEDVERMKRNAATPLDPDMAYFRFSGIGRLDQPSLRALKYLARWREETARERNRARSFVIPDNILLQLAKQRPKHADEIAATDGLHPVAASRYAKTLARLIEQAGQDTEHVTRLEQLTEAQRRKLKGMRDVIQKSAAKLSVDPALLGSRRELEKLLRAVAAGNEIPERFSGWRNTVVTDSLLALSR